MNEGIFRIKFRPDYIWYLFESIRINSTTGLLRAVEDFVALPSPSKLVGNTDLCANAYVCVMIHAASWNVESMRRNGSRRDVRASGVELLQSSCFVLSGVRGTLLEKEYQYGHRLKRGAHPGNTGLRPLRGVWAEMCLCCVPRGRAGQRVWSFSSKSHQGRLRFSLSLFYTLFCRRCVIFFFTTERERERQIQIFG